MHVWTILSVVSLVLLQNVSETNSYHKRKLAKGLFHDCEQTDGSDYNAFLC